MVHMEATVLNLVVMVVWLVVMAVMLNHSNIIWFNRLLKTLRIQH